MSPTHGVSQEMRIGNHLRYGYLPFIVGVDNPEEGVLLDMSVYLNTNKPTTETVLEYPPDGYVPKNVISYIEITNKEHQLGDQPKRVEILYGGVGYTYVSLKVISKECTTIFFNALIKGTY